MNIKKSFVSISAVTAMLLLTACSSDSGNSVESPVAPPVIVTKSMNLSGSVIDGYVLGADVTVGGFGATTDDAGFWSVPSVPFTNSLTIEASGGTDTSTGEPFEGKLKASVAENATAVNVTPLSTIVTSVVQSGVSVAQANAAVAAQLGISQDALAADPIERLKTGTPEQKVEAAKAIQTALVVQKMAETIATSAGTNTADKNTIFDAVMDSVAAALQNNQSFDTVMADTSAITTKAASQMQTQGTLENVTNLSEKLAASADAASEVVKMVQAIDPTEFSNATDVTAVLAAKSRALEVVTEAVEAAVSKIATASSVDSINLEKAATEKTTQTVTMFGGVDGMAATIKTQEAALVAGQVLDTASFSTSFFSEAAVAEQSAVYTNLATLGMTPAMITEVGKQISVVEKGQVVDTAAVIAAVVAATPNAQISSSNITQMTEAAAASVKNATDAGNIAAAVSVVIVTPPVVAPTDPVVAPPVVAPINPVVTPPVVAPTEPAVTPPVVAPTTPVVVPSVVTPPSSSSSSSTPAATTQTVSVITSGTSDASTLASTYNFTAGSTYSYTISGFAAGDVLNFPEGNTPTIINTTLGDTSLTVQWANSGSLITVNLTGIDTTKDAAIYGMTSFNTAFGASSMTAAAATTAATIEVAGTNTSYDASSSDKTFNLAAGTYTYTVAGFSTGDVLNFPEGMTPTVINTDFADNSLTLQWANSGSVITVNLTGITGMTSGSSDGTIYGVASFKTAFGESSIQ